MAGDKWIIIQRYQHESDEDGIRFMAFPLIKYELDNKDYLDSLVDNKNQRHWIVEEVNNGEKKE